jgi:hypothetical protein
MPVDRREEDAPKEAARSTGAVRGSWSSSSRVRVGLLLTVIVAMNGLGNQTLAQPPAAELRYSEPHQGLACGLQILGPVAWFPDLEIRIGLRPASAEKVSVALPPEHQRRLALPLLFRIELRDEDGAAVAVPGCQLGYSRQTGTYLWQVVDRILVQREHRIETTVGQHPSWDAWDLPPGRYQLRVVYWGLPAAELRPASTREGDLDQTVRGPVASAWVPFQIAAAPAGDPSQITPPAGLGESPDRPAFGAAVNGLRLGLQVAPWPRRYFPGQILTLCCVVENTAAHVQTIEVLPEQPYALSVCWDEHQLTSAAVWLGPGLALCYTLQPGQRALLPRTLVATCREGQDLGPELPEWHTPRIDSPGRYALVARLALEFGEAKALTLAAVPIEVVPRSR